MIERQGRLNWTKITEAGKKLRKNWLQQWVVLLSNNLLFYKDQKQATVVSITGCFKCQYISLFHFLYESYACVYLPYLIFVSC